MLRHLLCALLATVAAGLQAADNTCYRLVTSVADLVDGAQCVVVSYANGNYYTMSEYVSGTYCNSGRIYDAADFHDGMICTNKSLGEMTLHQYNGQNADYVGKWYFTTSAGKYYTATNNLSEYISLSNSLEFFSLLDITFSGEEATIACAVAKNDVVYDLKFTNTEHFSFSPLSTAHTYPVRLYVKTTDFYARDTAGEYYYTLCLPYAVGGLSSTGATFYEVAGTTRSEGEITGIVISEVSDLAAGRPYIFKAAGRKVVITAGEATATAPVAALGLVGRLDAGSADVPQGCYVLSNNTVRKVSGGTATVGQYRAYLDLDNVAEYAESSPAPAKRTVRLRLGEATAMLAPALQCGNKTAAAYDLSGRQATVGKRGIIIRNGRKSIAR